MSRHPRGFTLAAVLMVLAVAALLAAALGGLALANLQVVNTDRHTRTSLYAAEAGVAAAIDQLRADPAWTAGYPDVDYGGQSDASYQVEVSNNFQGSTPLAAPDGTSVPAGRCYLLATGRCLGNRHPRTVAVMLSGAVDAFPYALASGGTATLNASGDIRGTIRTNGDLVLNATTDVVPVNGQGRVLSAGRIDNKVLRMDSTQDVRARGAISDPEQISGTSTVVADDTTSDTEPMIADGRITNDGLPLTMPNPDLSVLLASGSYVDHTGKTSYSNKETLDLAGGVHYFPGGVTFANGSTIVGPGTVVSGGGNAITFNSPLNDATFNVVALDGDSGQSGTARVTFNQSTELTGLVYCHGNIEIKAHVTIDGRMIAYGGGQVTARSGASLDLSLEPVSVPGFAAFLGGGAPTPGGSLAVASWQRVPSR